MTGEERGPPIANRSGPDLNAVAGLLSPAGECTRCGQHAERLVIIVIVQGNSGPGWSRNGCIPCAKQPARYVLAPTWLREDVARLEAAGL